MTILLLLLGGRGRASFKLQRTMMALSSNPSPSAAREARAINDLLPAFSTTTWCGIMSEDFQKLVLYEDNELSVVYKPPTYLVQSDIEGAEESLIDCFKTNNAYGALLHRLDRPCSGLVLLAKTPSTAANLTDAFQNRRIVKKYLCMVNGKLVGQGHCHDWLLKTIGDKTRVIKKSSKMRPDVVDATLDYEAICSVKIGDVYQVQVIHE